MTCRCFITCDVKISSLIHDFFFLFLKFCNCERFRNLSKTRPYNFSDLLSSDADLWLVRTKKKFALWNEVFNIWLTDRLSFDISFFHFSRWKINKKKFPFDSKKISTNFSRLSLDENFWILMPRKVIAFFFFSFMTSLKMWLN